MSRDLQQLLEQAARGPCDAAPDPASIAGRARRQRVAAAAAVVLAIVAVTAAVVLGAQFTGQPAPYIDDSAPAGGDVWQEVEVGQAAFAVPADWSVHRLEEGDPQPCWLFRRPAVWIGTGEAPSECPSPEQAPPKTVGIVAIPFELLGGSWPEEQATEVAGLRGFVTTADDDTDHQFVFLAEGERQYVFPDLALILRVSYRPDPQLIEQILSTLHAADTTGPAIDSPAAHQEPDELVAEGGSNDTRSRPTSGVLNVTADGCDNTEHDVERVPMESQATVDLGGPHLEQPDRWSWPQVEPGYYLIRLSDQTGQLLAEQHVLIESGTEKTVRLPGC